MRDLRSNIDVAQTLVPAVRTAAGTGSAVAVGADYDGAMAEFSVGAWTDGTWTPKLQHSPTTAGTDFTDVAAADLQGTFSAILSTAGTNTIQRVGYNGGSAYVRGFLTGTGTTGIASSMTIIRGHAARRPLA